MINLQRAYTWLGHFFAFIGVGWSLIYHITGMGLIPALIGGIMAVWAWTRASAFNR